MIEEEIYSSENKYEYWSYVFKKVLQPYPRHMDVPRPGIESEP